MTLLTASLVAACTPPKPIELDATGVSVIYAAGTLQANLSPSYSNDQLAALAAVTLRARGYSIDSADRTLEEPAQLRGKRGSARWIQETLIAWRLTPSKTRLFVRVDPWGHEEESRVIMRDMLARLGYTPGNRGPLAANNQPPGTNTDADAPRPDSLFDPYAQSPR